MATDSHNPRPDAETYDLSLLEQSLAKWQASPGLRLVYKDIFRDMLGWRSSGSSLEIGSGCAFIRELDPDIVTSDVRKTEYVDRAVSAYSIHESDDRWGNILAFDVLHHLTDPFAFFGSSAKALERGGRLILCEPAATPFGRVFYRLFHAEPCRPASYRSPYRFSEDAAGEFANMGAAWALFKRDKDETSRRLEQIGLALAEVRFRDLFAYPATGGLSKPCLLPVPGLRAALAIERLLPQAIHRLLALRMLIVIEKQ